MHGPKDQLARRFKGAGATVGVLGPATLALREALRTVWVNSVHHWHQRPFDVGQGERYLSSRLPAKPFAGIKDVYVDSPPPWQTVQDALFYMDQNGMLCRENETGLSPTELSERLLYALKYVPSEAIVF